MPIIDLLACEIMLKICQETRFLSRGPFLPPSEYAHIFQNKILMLGKLQHVDRGSWLWLPSLNRGGFLSQRHQHNVYIIHSSSCVWDRCMGRLF